MRDDLLRTTSYAILGLLADGPMSGHALSTMADRSIAHFWSIPRSLVYRELSRLEELGYLSGADVAQQKLPDKREYRLTDSGRAELSRWLNQPGFEKGRFKDGFLVKFFFGRHMEPASRMQLLEEYRSQAQTYLQDLRAIAAKLEGIPGAEYPRLTALRGIRAAEGQLRWVEDVEQMIAENPGLLAAPTEDREVAR
jgi:PadR family transcriptional regulator AphA